MFVIEDERHAEPQRGEYATFAEAVEELKRRATLPWDKPPNVAPCQGWRTCGRAYEIVEYETFCIPWKELQRVPLLEVSASGAKWSKESQREGK